MSQPPNHYEILDIPITASDEQIKAAYRKAIREHHPDPFVGKLAQARESGDPVAIAVAERELHEAEEYTKRINEAYRVLSDPRRRFFYNLTLRVGSRPTTSTPPPPPRQSPPYSSQRPGSTYQGGEARPRDGGFQANPFKGGESNQKRSSSPPRGTPFTGSPPPHTQTRSYRPKPASTTRKPSWAWLWVILVVGVLRFALAIGDTDDRRPPTFPQTYTDYLATTEAMNRVLLGTPAYRNYEDLMATLEAGSSGIAISDSLQATLDEAYQGFDNVPFAMTITPEIPEVSSVVAEDALRQGDDFFARGQYALAVSQYDIVLRGNPSADVYYKRGMAYELQMRDPFDDLALKAMTDYSLAAQLDPAYAEAYLSMGQLYLTRWQLQGREFDHDRALEHLNHYVELVGAAVDPAIQELLDALNETP